MNPDLISIADGRSRDFFAEHTLPVHHTENVGAQFARFEHEMVSKEWLLREGSLKHLREISATQLQTIAPDDEF